MKIVDVRLPTGAIVSVFEEDIPHFPYPLTVVAPFRLEIFGQFYEFSQGTRYQCVGDRVVDVDALVSAAKARTFGDKVVLR